MYRRENNSLVSLCRRY